MSPKHQNLRARLHRLAGVLAIGGLLSCQPSPMAEPPASAEVASTTPRLLDGLGDQTHAIQTSSRRAQKYFDQGMILTFGFSHEAAIRSFAEAARLDPACGMCHWGIARALGPNINAPMGPAAAAKAYQEIQHALELTSDTSAPRERAYVEALAARYAEVEPEDRSTLDRAYADEMRRLHQADPKDFDAATLFAESLMDLYPWAYWTAEAEPREFTQEIIDTLERVLENAPSHVGANHYYIHAVEEY